MKIDKIIGLSFKVLMVLLLVVAIISFLVLDQEDLVDLGLKAAMIGFVIALLAAILLPIINSFSNPKELIKSLIGIAALGILFLIAWVTASNEVTLHYRSFNVNSETASQMIGGGLSMMYILFGIALLGIVATEINKALKS